MISSLPSSHITSTSPVACFSCRQVLQVVGDAESFAHGASLSTLRLMQVPLWQYRLLILNHFSNKGLCICFHLCICARVKRTFPSNQVHANGDHKETKPDPALRTAGAIHLKPYSSVSTARSPRAESTFTLPRVGTVEKM